MASPETGVTLGARLRAARLAAGMSQTDLARASGIPKPTLSRYENDHVSPSLATLDRLSVALDVTEASLLGEIGSPLDAFLRALAERGIVFADADDARSAADALAKLLKGRARAV